MLRLLLLQTKIKELLFIGSYDSKNHAMKKMYEKMKEKLLNSLKCNDEAEETKIKIVNVIDPKEGMKLINIYEGIVKSE